MSPSEQSLTATHLTISARGPQNITVWGWAQAAQSKVPIAPVITAGINANHWTLERILYILLRCDHGFIHCVKHGATAYHHGIGKNRALTF